MNRQQSEGPIRLCYLYGGLTALNNDGLKVVISAGVPTPPLGQIMIPNYSSLFRILTLEKLAIVGCDFYQHRDEVEELRPPIFRIYPPEGQGLDASQMWAIWRGIAHHAMDLDQMNLADCAARVAFCFQAIEHRVRELCKVYTLQLRALVVQKELQDKRYFGDLNSRPVIHGIHAVFYELAILRDYLAEFIARHVLGVPGEPIRTMGGLLKYYKKEQVDDEIYQEILTISSEDQGAPGWLAILTAYRNLFTHVSPLDQIGKKSMTVQEYMDTKGGLRLPVLYYPLPEDVFLIRNTRSRNFPYSTQEEWAKASMRHTPSRDTQPDALEYLHETTNKMVGLAARIAAKSPIASKKISLGPDDLIGPPKIETR